MQFPWLEELVKEGHVSPAARDEMMGDCEALIKAAIDVNSAEYKAFMEKALPYGKAAFGALAGLGWMIGLKVKDSRELKKNVGQIMQNKAEIVAQIPEHQDVAAARFDEIAQIAPSAALNRPFMDKMVTTRLHSGLTEQDVTTLGAIQATYMPKGGSQKKLQEKIAGENCADLYILTKEAIGGEFGKAFSKGLAIAAGLGTLSAAAGGVRSLAALKSSKDLQKRQAESFEAAINMSDPDREPLHANRDKAMQAFKTLVHFAPHVASDPQAARAFMNRVVSYGQGVDMSSIKDLADIERNMAQAHGPSPFLSGMAASAKFLGMDKAIGGAVESSMDPVNHALTSGVAKSMGIPYHDKAFESPADPWKNLADQFNTTGYDVSSHD